MANNVMIPLLGAEDIEVKVKQISEKGALALLYKTARTDMEYLDKIFGIGNWQCDYKEIKGNLYCVIQIWDEEKQAWVSKVDCGIESREDGEGNEKKGEASDAFKRAGFKVGIGRELYSSPFIWLNVETAKDNNGKWQLKDRFAKFEVKDIDYENRKISRLVIINQKTSEVVYTYGDSASRTRRTTSKQNEQKNPEPPKPTTPPKSVTTPNTEVKKEASNASVKVIDAIPNDNIPEHEKRFQSFLRKHKIEREKFIEMRAKAVNEGKNITAKSFRELTPEEWFKLLEDMESLYIEGYFKDVA